MFSLKNWLFNRFKPAPEELAAETCIEKVIIAARNPTLFLEFGVEDSVEGRMEMLYLHLALLLNSVEEKGEANFAQHLINQFLRQMDGNLREMGVGDLAVPKKIKAIGQSLYGRKAAFERVFSGEEPLNLMLLRNVYNDIPPANLEMMMKYVEDTYQSLKNEPFAQLFKGEVPFLK